MKRVIGGILMGLGIFSAMVSSLNARDAPNLSFLIGTYLPGVLLLIIGLVLRRVKTPATPDHSPKGAFELAGPEKDVYSNQFEARANLGVGAGCVTMFLGSGISLQCPDLFLAGTAVSLCGWALLIWGCVNYARWKGYSGWLGLFGYLLLLGLIILYCFPNRRKRALQRPGPEHVPEWEALSKRDRSSAYSLLLTLVPLGVIFVSVSGLVMSVRSNIDAAEWKEVAPSAAGFRALMPGTPRVESTAQETPAGTVEFHKFSVEPKGKKELFMIIVLRFPEGAGKQLGGREKLLELGRQDILTAPHGQLKSERKIVLGSLPGLELEILPPKGAIIKTRIYATNNQIYQATVHVPMFRLASDDVQKFFDSFQLFAEAQ